GVLCHASVTLAVFPTPLLVQEGARGWSPWRPSSEILPSPLGREWPASDHLLGSALSHGERVARQGRVRGPLPRQPLTGVFRRSDRTAPIRLTPAGADIARLSLRRPPLQRLLRQAQQPIQAQPHRIPPRPHPENQLPRLPPQPQPHP